MFKDLLMDERYFSEFIELTIKNLYREHKQVTHCDTLSEIGGPSFLYDVLIGIL